MAAYYNEIDPFAAAWLRELIKEGLIADGEVDERSIEDVRPDDLGSFVQCHFFAGIGVWSLALRQAGWPDDRPIWTGSCPCQPFSAAGKGGGFADERHLWPAMHWLVEQCRPVTVVGEQVVSRDGLAWLDLVQADVEGSGYAFGAVDTCAAGFGAPHIRQRLYWVAHSEREHGVQQFRPAMQRRRAGNAEQTGLGERIDGLADTNGGQCAGFSDGEGRECDGTAPGWQQGDSIAESGGELQRVADPIGAGLEGYGRSVEQHDASGRQEQDGHSAAHSFDLRPSPTNGYWRDADWLRCTDEKWRPVEPETFPVADAGAFRNRVGLLRGAGNAITIGQAQGFIEAVMDVI